MRQNEVKGYVSNLGKMSSFRAFKNYLSIIHLIKSEKYDLIYVNFMGLPYLFPLLLWLGIDPNRIVYPCHDFLDHVDIKNRRAISIYKKIYFSQFQAFSVFFKITTKTILGEI